MTVERAWALVKTAIFTLVMPCSVAVWFPWALGLIRTGTRREPAVEALGALMLVAGVLLYGACAFSFAWLGRGTPSPTDYTRSLVVAGPYRYSRNPMYVGVLLALIGEFILFGTSLPASIAYLIIFLLLVNLFIIAYEEPALRDKFGTEYDEYRRRVRRWF